MAKSKAPGRGIDPTGRSRCNQRFVRLDHWTLTCPAWKALSADGRAILIAIWSRYNAQNNGSIPFSTREAQDELGGSGERRALKAIRDAQDKGFLRLRKKGGFNVKGTNPASEYEITALPVPGPKDGASPSKDYATWEAPKKSTVVETTTRRCRNDNPSGVVTPFRAVKTTTRDAILAKSGLS